ncbi:ProQ/FINO family protein, partial [Roseiarcus sp.]|uniref:ProQ/FINO family protein n=1 Tax=Roseiarcus sp. TaxID=1969460 RepID=UPI003F9A8CAE
MKGVLETLSILREWFPLAFAAGRLRPFKVGIDKDIAERAPAITDRERARALRYHTRSDRYLRSMRPGAPRVDLDGNEVGAVTDDEAAHAKAILDRRRAKKAA